MKRPNFFYWYYNQGIWELLEIWKNLLFFIWRYFSIVKLSKNLFCPWHQNVSMQNWQGLHPFRVFELIIENITLRFIGIIVRLFVICTGIILFLLVLIAGLAINFLWISAPFIILFLFIYAAKGPLDPFVSGGFIFIWIVFSAYCYLLDTETPIVEMELDEFLNHKKQDAFERICGRFGMISKRFPKEVLNNDKLLDDFLKVHELTRKDYQQIVQWEILNEQQKNDLKKFWRWENLKKIKPIGTQWCYGYTINLNKYCKDLSKSDYAKYTKPELIGRSDEYEILKLVLLRSDQNCALLVGNSGIGKKTIIHFLACKICFMEEKEFDSVRILLFDLGKAISDAANKGKNIENFLRTLFNEANYAGNIILVVENLEQFLDKSINVFSRDISTVFAEFLNIPSFRIIATSTSKEYYNLLDKQRQIAKYFEVIEIREPSGDEALKILLTSLKRYESKRVLFTFKALKEIALHSGKYNCDFPLPKRALNLMMDTLMFWEKKSGEHFISEKTVVDYLALKTKIKQKKVESIVTEDNLHQNH